ncbi:hypothetical protein E8E12_000630 [Didymella heteroderae]|uniref:Uncharacterized protein n=1 Tax=Didymella heteroderae TaxID=1769908 RepID=A0A9P5BYL4_9PLEO|nr:hypothetical protein E8E12_000630 [Didymella heteroderae]
MPRDSSDIDEEVDTDSRFPIIDDLLPPPRLTDKATAYPGCCLALSTPLVAHLHSLLPPAPALTLSIGSGFGLLEALLLVAPYLSNVVGVEVAPSPNTYLPRANHRVVHGSRFHEPLAAEAEAWLFVYPRRVGLVNEYMASYGDDAVQTIIWIGPQADWDDYKGCFVGGWEIQTKSADQVGGKAWELIATARRATT